MIRNDLLQFKSKVVYHNEKLLSKFGVKDFDFHLNHIFAKNTDNYLLGNVFSAILRINFKNYSFLDITQIFTRESYEDRLYAFTRDELYENKLGKIPASKSFQIDFGSDPNYKYYFDFSYNHSSTEIGRRLWKNYLEKT